MLSKNKIKFINSIKKKKYRDLHKCFFVEGEKMIDELLKSELQILELFATTDWIAANNNQLPNKSIDIQYSQGAACTATVGEPLSLHPCTNLQIYVDRCWQQV